MIEPTNPSSAALAIAELGNLIKPGKLVEPIKLTAPGKFTKIKRPGGPPKNDSVERCLQAWNRTYNLASIDPNDTRLTPTSDREDRFAREQGSIAFRDAMPPLAGEENIRDFIACTTYAMLRGIFDREESRDLLHAAKVALVLLRVQARS
ncbi:MAG: hypothetical protein WCF30_08870 [Terracidiphilus sp.]